jgi:hypothetical protein
MSSAPSTPPSQLRTSLSPAEVIRRAIFLEHYQRFHPSTPPPATPPGNSKNWRDGDPVTPQRQVRLEELVRPSSKRAIRAVMWETCAGVVVEVEGRVLRDEWKRGREGFF